MQHLSLRDVVAEAEATIHRAIRLSKRGTAPAMCFHENYKWAPVLDVATTRLRALHRPGPHSTERLIAALRATGGAVRVIRICDLCPDDQPTETWAPAFVAACPKRWVREQTWSYFGSYPEHTLAAIAAANPAEREAMRRCRQAAIDGRDELLRGIAIDGAPEIGHLWAEAHGREITRPILSHDHNMLRTEHMASAMFGGIL